MDYRLSRKTIYSIGLFDLKHIVPHELHGQATKKGGDVGLKLLELHSGTFIQTIGEDPAQEDVAPLE